MESFLGLLLSTLLLSSRALASTDFSVTTTSNYAWNQSTWTLTSNRYIPGQYQARLSLANGYIGASLSSAGPFFETDVNQTHPDGGIQPINGWPLFDTRIAFSTISGFYDVQPNATGTNYPWLNQYGWESFISGIPHPTALVFAFGKTYLDATAKNTTISNFASSISFKTGVGKWSYTWTPEKSAALSASFNVSYTAIFSRVRPNVVAVEARITPSADISGTVTDLLDGRSAARSYLNSKGIDTNGTIYTSVHPNGLADITGYVVSGITANSFTNLSSRAVASGPYVGTNDTTIGQTWNINLKAGQTATFYKYVGAASSDKFSFPESIARTAQATAQNDGWAKLLSEHTEAWGKIMTDESVDDFTDAGGELPDDENVAILHISSIANVYYMLQNMQDDGSGLNDNSVSVGGLVSDSYAGLVFWDADYWMSPGLNLNFPSWAKQISNFRIKQHPQALANAVFNNYPNGSALYSWTAGKYGNCTGTGPCIDYEYHLNYDIAFNLLQQYNITQNQTWFDNGPRQIIESAAIMTSHLLQYNESTKSYWLHNMTDPDEYANNIDNGAFTISSAAELLKQANSLRELQGLSINETWETQLENIEYPSAPSNITLEYTGMNNSVAVKQADVVLLTYPLDFGQDYTEEDKLLDLDYYANKQSPNGPAMTYSIFAVNSNALSPSGCSAYTYTLNGFLPYLRAPWFQFSEQAVDDVTLNGNTNPAFPFLTGHGGANQVVPFGFLGVRTDQPVLYINPSLPPQIPSVKIRKFYYAGATLSATMNQTHTLITRLSTPSHAGVSDKYENGSLPLIVGTPDSPKSPSTPYNIVINQTITISNRLHWKKNTYTNNLLQCQPVSSSDAYAAGQFPQAAIDGATATRWQPATNETASLLVNMSSIPPSPISGMFFDFGARPPKSAVVFLGNMSNGEVIYGNEVVINVDGIQPNLPYNMAAALESNEEVVPVVGNTTTLAVAGGVWSGNYARLVVEGCWEGDGVGATVGEFVIIRA
ncbi:glycoside hydrolase family 65 protein [Tricladium varicosporioides]|nr:glycoside hydrolase family 65 protein [Hymenoscyphus varicosporioides]